MRNRLTRHVLPLLGLITIAAGLQRSVAYLGFDLHHDGLMYDAAFRVFNGEIPYRDFFYQYNLGTLFLHALSIALFGPLVASLKLVTVIAYAAIPALIYLCAVRSAGIAVSFMAALAWALLSPFYFPELSGYHPWSTVYMMASIMLGAYFLIRSFCSHSRMLAGAGGFFIALAFWFKQVALVHYAGALTLLVLTATISADRHPSGRQWAMPASFLMGLLMCWLPFGLYLGYHGLWPEWWQSAFLFNSLWALGQGEGSGFGRMLPLLFHPNHEFGYSSIIWAVLPAYLLAATIIRAFSGTVARWWSRPGRQGIVLLVLFGFSGWMLYYPVPHSFHTQMFMAPAFSLVAMEITVLASAMRKDLGQDWTRPLLVAMLSLVLILLVYEAARHAEGLYRKLRQPWQPVQIGSIADGLFFQPQEWESFSRFHRTIGVLPYFDRPRVPLSVDPLRVLFPYVRAESTMFRMGVDWSWLTEKAEPGFRERVRASLRERRAIVYTDGALAIPGYVPVAMLAMESRGNPSRMLFVPSRDNGLPSSHVSIAELTGPEGLPASVRNEERRRNDMSYMLIYPVQVPGFPAASISQLHVMYLRDAGIPRVLFPVQFEWLKLLAKDTEWHAIPESYEPDSGRYRLKSTLAPETRFLLGRFFLSHRQLLDTRESIRYVSTVFDAPLHRPFYLGGSTSAYGSTDRRHSAIAVPVPGYAQAEPASFYWQIVRAEGTTESGYARYPGWSNGMDGRR